MSTAASRNALNGGSVQKVILYDGGGNPLASSVAAAADAVANPTVGGIADFGMAYNGATWDRLRNNTALVAYASSARVDTPAAYTFTNYNHHALMATLSVISITGSPSVTVTIDGQDANGNWRNLLTGAAITASTAAIYKIGPSIAAATNLIAQDYLPRALRMTPTHAASGPSMTYVAAVELI